MKLYFALFTLFACLISGLAMAEVGVASGSSQESVQGQNTVPIGGTVTVLNASSSGVVLTASLGGTAGEPVFIPAGGTYSLTIPNDPSLVGLKLRIGSTPVAEQGAAHELIGIKTWLITA